MIITSEDGKNYKLLDKICAGAFSTCYRGYESITKEVVACKSMDKKGAINAYHLDKEVTIHGSLSHRNIVKFIDSFQDDHNVYILTRFCSEGTLEEYVEKRHPLPKYVSQTFMYQLLQAVKYLHEKNIIHMDLKPKNVFLDDERVVKLGDFGLAIPLSDAKSQRGNVMGTRKYMSPEIRKARDFGLEVDIWGYGCVMHYVLLSITDYENMKSKKCMDIKALLPNHAYRLLISLLKEYPGDRPSIRDIENHNYFKEIPDDEPWRMSINDTDSSSSDDSVSSVELARQAVIKLIEGRKEREKIEAEEREKKEKVETEKKMEREIIEVETSLEINTELIDNPECDNETKIEDQEACVIQIDDETSKMMSDEVVADQKEAPSTLERYRCQLTFAMKYGIQIIVLVLVIAGVITAFTLLNPFK